ncbi:O-antigen ligase family protein [Zobellia laminariae]|uniref:O-antigen ligase family protein n=1 Tax=Zobellia laminariae TaxID=248906 RepID=UPI0026F4223D|nr:O-antigen ligase family protein [Zobellia laminariae]WKX77991.1 O-antigen ligase family protein [Zobellia laminariae]
MYKFLSGFFKTIIILGLIQLFFGGVYFNTQDRLPAVNIFFWNENEYSSVLAIFAPLFFLREKGYAKYLWIAVATYLMIYNDAKLAVFSLIVFFAGMFVLKNKLLKVKYLGFILLAIIGIVVLFLLKSYSIQGEYTIEYFISRLTEHIWLREPLLHIGTFNARSNAVILGIKEFLDSYCLGIGPGNSLPMMKEIVVPGTEKYTALSMHNFTLQIITEMGLFGIGIIALFIMKIVKAAEESIYDDNLWSFFSLLAALFQSHYYQVLGQTISIFLSCSMH